jgi:aminotransferase
MLKIHQYCDDVRAKHGSVCGLKALKNGMEDVEKMKKSYRRRRNLFVDSLNEIGLSCHHPGGAFYAFPSIKKTGMSSEQFAEELLIAGKSRRRSREMCFGPSGEGYIRCSYATSIEQLQEALVRMKRFVHKGRCNIKKDTNLERFASNKRGEY